MLRGEDPVLRREDVLIQGDVIAAVGENVPPPPGAQVLDASRFIVVPGLINAHTHSHNNLLRGLADNWTLEELLNHGAALNAERDYEDHYLSAALGAVEMLKTGTTAAYDLFMAWPAPTEEAVAAVVQAYVDVGLRAVVAPAVADIVFYRTVPGLSDLLTPELQTLVRSMEAAPTRHLAALAENAIRRFDGAAGGRVRVGLAPTIPGQCTDELLEAFAGLAREYGVTLHTHLAETKVQVIHAQRRWGKTIVQQCRDAGLLGSHFVGAHAIWLTDGDMRLMGEAGATAVHNPASNLKLGSGIAPVREWLDHGIGAALGTDGSMSSDNQNMFEAMHLAAMLSNVRHPHQPERWPGAREVWRMATAGGARGLGDPDELGRIEAGCKADLVLLDADSAALKPLNHPVNPLVYIESGASVDTVIVDGRLVVAGGRVLTVDEDRLRRRAQAAAERLRAANTERFELARRLTPYIAAACRQAVLEPYPVNRYAVSV